MNIDSTAKVHPGARLHADVEVGPFAIIEENVEIGEGSRIGPFTQLKANTKLGRRNELHAGVILGDAPQDLSQRQVESELIIGDDNVFREYVTIHRGSSKQDRQTRIGSNNLFMVNSHVGHDCVVGNHVVMVNGAVLAGHTRIEDHVILGAFCAIHQFCQVGAYTMLSRGAMANKDILPYLMVAGNEPQVFGLNKVGLRRKGFSAEEISTLTRAYKLIFRQGLTREEAIEALRPLAEECPPVRRFIDGLQAATRGIVR